MHSSHESPLEIKIDNKKETLKIYEIETFALGLINSADSSIVPSINLIHLGGSLIDFKTQELSDELLIAILVEKASQKPISKNGQIQNQTTHIFFLRLDYNTLVLNMIGSINLQSKCRKFDFFSLKKDLKGIFSIRVFLIDFEHSFLTGLIQFLPNETTLNFGKSLENMIFKKFCDFSHFTCFDFCSNKVEFDCFRISIGTKLGSIYHFSLKSNLLTLLRVFNEFTNFNVLEVKIFEIRKDESTCQNNKQNPELSIFICMVTSDGELKIFRENETQSLIQIQFQNRPLRCLQIDPCLSLIYILDEADPNLLTVVNFSKQPESGKNTDSLKRNIKFDHSLSFMDFNFSADSFSVVFESNSIKTLPLRVFLKEFKGDYFSVQSKKFKTE